MCSRFEGYQDTACNEVGVRLGHSQLTDTSSTARGSANAVGQSGPFIFMRLLSVRFWIKLVVALPLHLFKTSHDMILCMASVSRSDGSPSLKIADL